MDLLTQRRAMMMAQGTEPQYVTDGLIHWLDGIDKGASDGTWVDLIGGHVYTNYGHVTPISNGFYFDGVDDRFYNNTFKVVTTPTTHTIEVVLSEAQVGSSGGFCLFTSHATAYTDKRFYVAFVGFKSKICLSAAEAYPMYNYTSAEDIKSIVSCPDGRCYINNVPSVSDENNYYSCTTTANRVGVGYYSGSERHFYKGNIHAIRIYDRSLTAEEVAHNYALDLRRFNL
jgi:hypothetical protein